MREKQLPDKHDHTRLHLLSLPHRSPLHRIPLKRECRIKIGCFIKTKENGRGDSTAQVMSGHAWHSNFLTEHTIGSCSVYVCKGGLNQKEPNPKTQNLELGDYLMEHMGISQVPLGKSNNAPSPLKHKNLWNL